LRVFLVLDEDSDFSTIPKRDDDIVVYGKSDLYNKYNGISVSGETGAGIDRLVSNVGSVLAGRASGASVAMRFRHRAAIDSAISLLNSARSVVSSGPESSELAAAELHGAIGALGTLIGRVDIEQVLDEIFASFCLGK